MYMRVWLFPADPLSLKVLSCGYCLRFVELQSAQNFGESVPTVPFLLIPDTPENVLQDTYYWHSLALIWGISAVPQISKQVLTNIVPEIGLQEVSHGFQTLSSIMLAIAVDATHQGYACLAHVYWLGEQMHEWNNRLKQFGAKCLYRWCSLCCIGP